MNVYFDLPVSEIGQVGLRESQISFLRSRALDGKVVFMVYNSRFKNAYTKLTFLRIFHIIQVVVAIVSLLIANLAMYPAMDINEFML